MTMTTDNSIKVITPLYDRVLVKRITEEETSKGGIIIPDVAKEKPQEGVVITTGLGKVTDDGRQIPLTVKSNDHILFGKYSGQDIKVGTEDYVILREDEILATLTTLK